MLYRHDFTLEELIEKQLNKIPLDIWLSSTTTFCDPSVGGGQYIKAIITRLLSHGHSVENITKRVFGYGPGQFQLRAATKRLPGTFEVKTYEEILKMDEKKFNVVVSNPPYQTASKNNQKLWDKFVIKAINICKPSGYIGFITPSSWMSPNKMFEVMTAKKLLWVQSDVSNYFPNVGTTASAWIMKNEPGDNHTIIDDIEVDWSKIGLIPHDRSSVAMSIINKFLGCKKKIKFERSFTHYSQGPFVSKESNKEFKYPIFHTPTAGLNKDGIIWSNKPHEYSTSKKVIVSYSGYWKPFYDNQLGVTEGSWVIPVKSKKQGENLIGILTSKIFKFVMANTKYSGFYTQKMFERFPHVDSTRPWTDAELYDHFGLTKEEIEHVETNTRGN